MKNFYFLMVLHFHQPVDNFGFVIEKACKRCYAPFLDTIKEFPDIRFNLHYSGSLLEWFKYNRPDILEKIGGLVKKGQVELIGGGFYEPIFSALPKADSIGQIRMLSEFLKNEFNVMPSGAWLPERVWEPQLASVLSEAGIRYTVIDDAHLRYAGLTQKELYGYYVTEDSGKCVDIFASDMLLRYIIPFHNQKETIDYFRRIKNQHRRDCVLYGDDGEKFGEWPKTNEAVYKKKWLFNFLKLLRRNSSWLRTEKLSDYIAKEPPIGRLYIPTASYQEMNEWALPAESAERLEKVLKNLKDKRVSDRYMDFIRGGFWRNFFVKYPESNHMHKRMLLVSERLNRLRKVCSRKLLGSLEAATRELYRAQCNCSYWHGVFGGLYLYHLRSAIYRRLIAADRIADSLEYKGKAWMHIDKRDFDCDGMDELIVNTPKDAYIINPAKGATITEWDIKAKALNITNTLSRRKEHYHGRLKELILHKPEASNVVAAGGSGSSRRGRHRNELIYDAYQKSLFMDHFIRGEIDLRRLCRNRCREEGDFLNGIYSKVSSNPAKGRSIELRKKGFVAGRAVRVAKRFSFYPKRDIINARYDIRNLGPGRLCVSFIPELNFSLTKDDLKGTLPSTDRIILSDYIEEVSLKIRFSEKAEKVFRFPIYTISQSERDVEENYQASSILPVFGLRLGKNNTKTIIIEIEASYR